VQAEKEQLQLADDRVLVVARIADQRRPLLVTRQVDLTTRIGAEQHAHAVRATPVLEWLVDRPRAVDRVEVEARRTEVDERVGVVLALQRR
jgi:hypothetical protein